ncbi:MAG: aldo/keto reductase [Rhizomicrobium sp.]
MGSVQLGLAYGAANRTGKPSHEEALRLVARATEGGISQFDTARAYGDSEDRLGIPRRCARGRGRKHRGNHWRRCGATDWIVCCCIAPSTCAAMAARSGNA